MRGLLLLVSHPFFFLTFCRCDAHCPFLCAVCFLAIVPLEQMFDFLGEQMMFYLGKSLGELLIITLNKSVLSSFFQHPKYPH
jgi:hypothetical protein